ncbi:hypothetical protein DENSPDRAFT_828693 [Dentipellis sp. KUC8613]|nr:hypothetical protein DENSPDRAFT_828693 [Dentipellis sp. KUC8613]
MKPDLLRRSTKKREDTQPRRHEIASARKSIFELGRGVKSKAVDVVLKPQSLVPVRNAFSDLLAPFNDNLYDKFVVDLLHEFELGVWKGTFAHLIRLLIAIGGNQVQELNTRYRSVPRFGSSTIRPFSNDAAAMKKLAARDFEDLLQVCSLLIRLYAAAVLH